MASTTKSCMTCRVLTLVAIAIAVVSVGLVLAGLVVAGSALYIAALIVFVVGEFFTVKVGLVSHCNAKHPGFARD